MRLSEPHGMRSLSLDDRQQEMKKALLVILAFAVLHFVMCQYLGKHMNPFPPRDGTRRSATEEMWNRMALVVLLPGVFIHDILPDGLPGWIESYAPRVLYSLVFGSLVACLVYWPLTRLWRRPSLSIR